MRFRVSTSPPAVLTMIWTGATSEKSYFGYTVQPILNSLHFPYERLANTLLECLNVSPAYSPKPTIMPLSTWPGCHFSPWIKTLDSFYRWKNTCNNNAPIVMIRLCFSVLQLLMQVHDKSLQALPETLLQCFFFPFLFFIYFKSLSFQCKVMLPQGFGGGGSQDAFSALLTLWSIQNALVKIQPGQDAH